MLNKENIYYKNQKGIQGLTTIQEDKIHIIMNLNNSLEDHFLLAHELMHGLVLKNSFPFLKMDERLFEIESHFIEFLLSDFLLKNKYEENSILNYNLKRSKMVFRHAHRSFWELNLINVYNQFGSLEKDLVYNYFKTSYLVHDQEKIKLIIQGLTKEKFNLNYALRYFWGELISHQLYTNYKKEPAYNLNLFKNYIYNNSSLTFEKGLEKLNISFNPQIINNYAKYVKNNQLKLKTLEKKYK